MDELEKTLAAVASGELSPESAAGRLKRGEVRYLDGFAALDLGRSIRKGVPEVVYASSKSPTQVASICATLLESCERVIVSTPTPEHEARIRATLPETQLRWAPARWRSLERSIPTAWWSPPGWKVPCRAWYLVSSPCPL
jgi:NCAIR mutase (PurE)-related protein